MNNKYFERHFGSPKRSTLRWATSLFWVFWAVGIISGLTITGLIICILYKILTKM